MGEFVYPTPVRRLLKGDDEDAQILTSFLLGTKGRGERNNAIISDD